MRKSFRTFVVKLEGPRRTGKSTFMNMILRNIKDETVKITKVGEHELEVEMVKNLFSSNKKRKEKNQCLP